MHPEVTSDKPGVCHKCGGMELVRVGEESKHYHKAPHANKLKTFLPLIVIFGLLSIVSLVQVSVLNKVSDLHMTTHAMGMTMNVSSSLMSNVEVFMASFMGGFFIVFGAFKLLDLKGFAHGFSTYDLVAKQLPEYGYVYPFIELSLGFMFLLHNELAFVSAITLLIASIGVLSVWLRLRKKETIQCVCLGTVFDLPLTNVTLFENLIMAVMSVNMLTRM